MRFGVIDVVSVLEENRGDAEPRLDLDDGKERQLALANGFQALDSLAELAAILVEGFKPRTRIFRPAEIHFDGKQEQQMRKTKIGGKFEVRVLSMRTEKGGNRRSWMPENRRSAETKM
ncbi:hypothetical protein ACLOJK_031553 [Asimina triloba]